MGKRVAIIQSNYIPWKGYFDAINAVDEFVLLDDAQYTRRDWRNRNRIKTAAGEVRWLTVPVAVKGRYTQRIDETRISDPRFGERHWRTLQHAYGRAPWFGPVAEWLAPLYLERAYERLSDCNRALLQAVCDALGIGTPLSWSTDYGVGGARSERLIALCRATGADEYLSGPAARTYLDEAAFAAAGIRVRWIDYDGYPPYEQFAPPFEHRVSILDLLFHTGPDAPRYMKTFGVGGGDLL